MKYLVERKNFKKYEIGDKVLIEYWYSGMITCVSIIDKKGSKFHISHNVSESQIKNAPDEWIRPADIIDIKR